MEWRAIETAPANGELILLALPERFSSNDALGYAPWVETRVVLGWRGGGGFACCFMEDGAADTEGFCSQFYMTVHPTHWMPLPDPPS